MKKGAKYAKKGIRRANMDAFVQNPRLSAESAQKITTSMKKTTAFPTKKGVSNTKEENAGNARTDYTSERIMLVISKSQAVFMRTGFV